MKGQTDTNFGWWTDKPERRESYESSRFQPIPTDARSSREGGGVWLKSVLVIGSVVGLTWVLKLAFLA